MRVGDNTMCRLIGSVDLIFAFMFFVFGGISLFGVPSQYADRIREPEDFYGLLFLFLLTIVIAIIFFLVGVRTFRQQPYSQRETPILWFVSIALSVVLLAVALLDLMGPTDPGTFGLRLLVVPASALWLSAIYSIVYSRRFGASIRD